MSKGSIIKILYYIAFILIFFPMFVIYIVPNTIGNIQISCILWIVIYITAMLTNPKKFRITLLRLYKFKITKIYLVFILFSILITLFHIIMGEYIAPVGYYAIRLYRFYIFTFLLFIFPVFSTFFNISFKNIISLTYCTTWSIYLLSFIQFFTYKYNILIINYIFQFLTNARIALYRDPSEILNITRVHGFFSEPSALGAFTFIMLPIIINLSTSNIKIINNKFLNSLIKKTFIPLMIIVLFMTKSPIYIILCVVEVIILFSIRYFSKIKYLLAILSILVISICLNLNIFIGIIENMSFYKRITAVIYSLRSFDNLCLFEPSLASRIISYTQQIIVFKEHIFTGVGVANVGIAINYIFWKTPLSITKESLRNYIFYADRVGYNASVIYTTAAEVGIIGLILYLIFVIANMKNLNFVHSRFQGLEKIFTGGLKKSMICICILSFYNLNLCSELLWFIFGLTLLTIYQFKYYTILKCIKSKNGENNA